MHKNIGSWRVDIYDGTVTARKYNKRDRLTIMLTWKYSYEPNAKRLYDRLRTVLDIETQDSAIRTSTVFFGKKSWR